MSKLAPMHNPPVLVSPRGSGCDVSHCLLCKRPLKGVTEGFWLGDRMHLRFVIVHVECIAQLRFQSPEGEIGHCKNKKAPRL